MKKLALLITAVLVALPACTAVSLASNNVQQHKDGSNLAAAPQMPEPCGYVEFQPIQQPRIDRTGRVLEYISLHVHFSDGTQKAVDLDYPFTYPTAGVDPFVPGHDNIPATFQFPPLDKRASEPSLVQYVMEHTTPEGYTRLHDCGK